jgi:hypothetical protein
VQGLITISFIIGIFVRDALINISHDSGKQLILVTMICTLFVYGGLEYFIGVPAQFADSLFWLVLGYLAYAAKSLPSPEHPTASTPGKLESANALPLQCADARR